MLQFETASPESTGVPSRCILQFIERLDRHHVPMHSILLMHQDKLIAEGYYAPYKRDTLHRMFSISKSFASIAIGMLADEGKLALEDPIIKYFPDKVPADVHPWIAGMTIRDMLMMRTCHASTTYKLDMTSDWVESFFTVLPTHPAGKIFHYDTSSAHTLAALAERLSEKPMLEYIKEKLAVLHFSEDSYMLTDPFGVSMGGSGLMATPMDLMKFGYFISHEGNVAGTQLLSPEYIRTAVSKLSDTAMTAPLPSEACGYGYQFWRNEKNGYVCYGMGGQFINFIPDKNLILVTTADTQGIAGGNQLIYDALYEEILPYIQQNPLSEDKKSHTELQNLLASLEIQPLDAGDAFLQKFSKQAINSCISPDMTFSFEENAFGFSKMQLSLSPDSDSGTLLMTLHDEECKFSFGFGKLESGIFPQYDQKYVASGKWISPDTLYLRFHIIDEYVGSVHMEFAFGQNDVTVFLKKQEESLFHEYNCHLYGTRI
jgi:CubicO group peptidase (beta-lactamase class C family)